MMNPVAMIVLTRTIVLNRRFAFAPTPPNSVLWLPPQPEVLVVSAAPIPYELQSLFLWRVDI